MKYLLPKSSLAFRFAGFLAIIILAGCAVEDRGIDGTMHPDTESWDNLFASDLSNAIGAEDWKLEDGVLVAKDHNPIWTKASYGDFVLDLEFKVAKESNSGVFLRSGDIKMSCLLWRFRFMIRPMEPNTAWLGPYTMLSLHRKRCPNPSANGTTSPLPAMAVWLNWSSTENWFSMRTWIIGPKRGSIQMARTTNSPSP
jgi:hypothetical protein